MNEKLNRFLEEGTYSYVALGSLMVYIQDIYH